MRDFAPQEKGHTGRTHKLRMESSDPTWNRPWTYLTSPPLYIEQHKSKEAAAARSAHFWQTMTCLVPNKVSSGGQGTWLGLKAQSYPLAAKIHLRLCEGIMMLRQCANCSGFRGERSRRNRLNLLFFSTEGRQTSFFFSQTVHICALVENLKYTEAEYFIT